jgi:hypothetical protein
MQLVITSTGQVRCVYDETIDLTSLGRLNVTRASHVEPHLQCQWFVDLTPVLGPQLGPFLRRSDALAAELAWLLNHWLVSSHH